MKIVVLDAKTLGEDLDLSLFSALGDLQIFPSTAEDQVKERAQGAQVAIVNKVRCNRQTLGESPSLKLICIAATGYDSIDLDFCREKGIAVCNVPGYSADSVAQLTAAMVFSLFTHLAEYSAYVSSGDYSKSGIANRLTPVFHELAGKTWGIVGYGKIGKKVAEIARAVGCRVVFCRRHPTGEADETDLDTLCQTCDIITVHTPLDASTRNLINARRIVEMKDGVLLVNTARGAVMDEEAAAQAVLQGKIGALGVDVYSKEPFPSDHPFASLLSLPNVCLTPHIAWGAYESRKRCMDLIFSNIQAFCRGEAQNRVN